MHREKVMTLPCRRRGWRCKVLLVWITAGMGVERGTLDDLATSAGNVDPSRVPLGLYSVQVKHT